MYCRRAACLFSTNSYGCVKAASQPVVHNPMHQGKLLPSRTREPSSGLRAGSGFFAANVPSTTYCPSHLRSTIVRHISAQCGECAHVGPRYRGNIVRFAVGFRAPTVGARENQRQTVESCGSSGRQQPTSKPYPHFGLGASLRALVGRG